MGGSACNTCGDVQNKYAMLLEYRARGDSLAMTTDTRSKSQGDKKSIWTSWIGSLKDAWTQAKLDYQEELQKSRAKAASMRKKPANETTNFAVPQKTRATRGRRRGRGRGRGSTDLRKQATAAQHKRQVEETYSTQEQDEDNTAAPSLLDASFLENIRTGDNVQEPFSQHLSPVLEDNVHEDESPTRKRKRMEDCAGGLENESSASRTLSVLGTEIDEEYVLRVQRRVQELEAELEAARARLSVYEQTRTYNMSLADNTPAITAAANVETQDAEKEQFEIIQMREDVHDEDRDEDAFVLSPSKLQLSPIRVELADMSNGEMARREAVAALKERVKASFPS